MTAIVSLSSAMSPHRLCHRRARILRQAPALPGSGLTHANRTPFRPRGPAGDRRAGCRGSRLACVLGLGDHGVSRVGGRSGGCVRPRQDQISPTAACSIAAHTSRESVPIDAVQASGAPTKHPVVSDRLLSRKPRSMRARLGRSVYDHGPCREDPGEIGGSPSVAGA